MKTIQNSFFSVILILLSLVLALASTESHGNEEFDPAVVSRSLESIEFQTFIAGFREGDALDESIRKVSKQRSRILQCISDVEKSLSTTTATVGQEIIDRLSEKVDLTTQEEILSSKVSDMDARLNTCKLLLQKTNGLLDKLGNLRAELKQQTLVLKNPHFIESLKNGIAEAPAYARKTLLDQFALHGLVFQKKTVITGILFVLAGFLGGVVISRRTGRPRLREHAAFAANFTTLTGYLLKKWSPVLLPLVAAGAYIVLVLGYQFRHSQLNQLLQLGVGFVLGQIFIRVGVSRYAAFLGVTSKTVFPVKRLYFRLVVALSLLVIWILFVVMPEATTFKTPAAVFFESVLALLILLTHIELAIFLRRIPNLPILANSARILAVFLFLASFILELFGYSNLSRLLWGGVVMSAILLTTFYVLEKLARGFFDGLETGQRNWQQKFRRFLSVEDEQGVPGLVWFRLLSILLLWIFLGYGILRAWGVSESTLASLVSYAMDGFKIGDSLITPSNIVIGVFTFALLVLAISWFKDNLDRKYLSRSRMDIGAREALTTITGYVGFVVSALVGLSIAGVSFDNLAIVAGALSLGIGFGLQNIVNNFVSGIILLFERPIKTGDWVVIGSTEGYVKKIRVRSTEVQTFDRSDVIVPNSELISTQVTNWTLRDTYGRVIVRVGVAYGSNTEQVREVLESTTKNIPGIVHDRPTLPIKVLFLGFGDSSLDFELRCFIYDVSTLLDVKSQLHFAIDKSFREHGIEIPFPQRDLHIDKKD